MKENTLNDAKKGHSTNSSNETASSITNSSNETTSVTNNASNETISVTNTATTRSNDTYVYGIGIVAVLAISVCVCVFFAYNTFQPKFKKLTNDRSTSQHQQKKINHQNDVLCFRSYIINDWLRRLSE